MLVCLCLLSRCHPSSSRSQRVRWTSTGTTCKAAWMLKSLNHGISPVPTCNHRPFLLAVQGMAGAGFCVLQQFKHEDSSVSRWAVWHFTRTVVT